MLGDTGIAVHPDDDRYKDIELVRFAIQFQLLIRKIKIVADDYAKADHGFRSC